MINKTTKLLFAVLLLLGGYNNANANEESKDFASVKAIEDKLGKENVDEYLYTIYPMIYAAFCQKQGVEIDDASKEAIIKHADKQHIAHPDLQDMFGEQSDLSQEEKATLLTYNIYLVQKNLDDKTLSCEKMNEQVNAGLPRLR